MRYTQFTNPQVQQMLDVIGVDSIDDLFSTIPPALRFTKPLDIPEGISELELLRDVGSLAEKNTSCDKLTCFLGAGAYDHFIPTVVDGLASQTEFLTAYTPYQAEASQGILQLFFEFQSMVCLLTGMEAANASLYEGASAAAEAMYMAAGITRRNRIVIAESAHPDIRQVIQTYARERGVEIATVPAPNGTVDETALAKVIDKQTAAVLIQSPNLYGCLERLDRIIPVIHEAGALAIVSTDPLAAGILKPVGNFGADIVVGEGQALGIPMQYGGPYLGLLAGRKKYLRKMPGRVVGMTKDADGRRGFCLSLQTREQHIKRERATSNVCTNQGLLAIRASIYMASMGRNGIQQVAGQCFDKAHYAAQQITQLKNYELRFDAPFFKEFTVRTTHNVQDVIQSCRDNDILAGVPLARLDERFTDSILIAVTEKRTREEIDQLVAALGAV